MLIPISKILVNPEQPRRLFDESELQGLAESIRENGLIQPIIVEEAGRSYIIHDGERRLRAHKLLGLKEIEAVVTPSLNGTARTDRLMRAMVANIQRADLGPVEEARAYRRMVDELDMTNIDIARKLGVSPARIATRLKILALEPQIQDEIERGRLPKDNRMVDALLSIPDSAARVKTAIGLAERNVSIKAGVEACGRVVGALAQEAIQAGTVPAIHLAVRRKPVDRPAWDALSKSGRLPPWLLFEIGVRDVCKKCELHDIASSTTCKDCQLSELVIELIGKAQ